MDKKHTVYAFAHPDTALVHYIGVTTHTPRTRYSQIKYGYKRGQFQEVGAWLLSLGEREPSIITLEAGTPDGINGEKRWIALFRQMGAPLCNKSDGGQGTNGVLHTEEWKKNNSRLLTGQKRSEETKAKIAASKVGKPRADLAERNKSNRRFTSEQITDIKQLVDNRVPMKEIGLKYGVSASLVHMIKSGKRYAS